jgi:hypothetical protein
VAGLPYRGATRRINSPVIALNAAYHAGPSSDQECVAHLLVTKRECTAELVALLEHLDRRDTQPRLHTLGGTTREIERCEWNQLVLGQRAVSLLKDDFESFFERESWFREKRLPFRLIGLITRAQIVFEAPPALSIPGFRQTRSLVILTVDARPKRSCPLKSTLGPTSYASNLPKHQLRYRRLRPPTFFYVQPEVML